MSHLDIQDHDWTETVPHTLRGPILFGLFILLTSLTGFGGWAVTAPLDSAVIASGKFVATGQNKLVQHFEGGIVRAIKVSEGDKVRKGEVLMTLDETGPRANLQLLSHRHNRLKAVQGRLIAESRWAEQVVFPERLRTAAYKNRDENVRQILERQDEEFRARRNKMLAEIAVLEQEIATRDEAISGHKGEISATKIQLDLLGLELKNKTILYKKKLMVLPKLLELKRARASLEGRIAILASSIAEQRKNIIRTQRQILQLRASAVDQAIAELRKVEGEIDDIEEQLRKADDVLARIKITSPVDGIVVKLMQHTSGGVIRPGGGILELVPVGDEPVIEARIKPRDIDQIRDGQSVQVRLTALNQRLTPMVAGQVVYVSADTVESADGSSANGYVVRVRLQSDEMASLPEFRPVPGMPVEAFIKTGERTFFDYLMRPVMDSMARAFRET